MYPPTMRFSNLGVHAKQMVTRLLMGCIDITSMHTLKVFFCVIGISYYVKALQGIAQWRLGRW